MDICEIRKLQDTIEYGVAATLAFISSLIIPIHDFILAVILFASVNAIFGMAEDKFIFSFKKAFKTFTYLIGYLFLIILTVLGSTLVRVSNTDIIIIVSWETYVMIWFYMVNILRNWKLLQPKNGVISFLYWVISFKIIEKINFLQEYIDKHNHNDKNTDSNCAKKVL